MVHVMPYTLPIIKVPFQICFISKDVILKSVTKVDNHLVTANLFFTIRSTLRAALPVSVSGTRLETGTFTSVVLLSVE